MATVVSRVETSHSDAINDAQLNYHGSRLATCSSDKTIKVFEIRSNGKSYPMQELVGHSGPVWKLCWAHPNYDTILASAGYDKRVIIWQEVSNRWVQQYEYKGHESSVNCVAFAPPQFGLILATASSDGSVAVLSFQLNTNQWEAQRIVKAHEQGVNAVSWAPPVHLAAFEGTGNESRFVRRFASCGNDKLIKIWTQTELNGEWKLEKTLTGHSDFVRDVAWKPTVLHDVLTIASVGQDRSLLLWRCKGTGEGEWSAKQLERAEGALWHVSWSLDGITLAVSGEDNKIVYWKENLQREWMRIAEENE